MSLVVVFFTFVRDNLPQRGDLTWLQGGGGMFASGQEPPSHRFNAGEKVVFWGGVLVLGVIVVGSGLVLDKLIPGFVYTRGDMQVAHMVHAVATVLMMCAVPRPHLPRHDRHAGRLHGDAHGYVDEAWAKEHHESGTTTSRPARSRRSAASRRPPLPRSRARLTHRR